MQAHEKWCPAALQRREICKSRHCMGYQGLPQMQSLLVTLTPCEQIILASCSQKPMTGRHLEDFKDSNAAACTNQPFHICLIAWRCPLAQCRTITMPCTDIHEHSSWALSSVSMQKPGPCSMLHSGSYLLAWPVPHFLVSHFCWCHRLTSGNFRFDVLDMHPDDGPKPPWHVRA